MSHGRAVNSVFPLDKCLTRRPRTFGKLRHGCLALKKAVYTMHPNGILHEVQQLYTVSDRLDSLAEQHPLVSEALITIFGKRS